MAVPRQEPPADGRHSATARSLAARLTESWPASESVRPSAILANLIVFVDDLRLVGVPVGTGQFINLVEAFAAVDLGRRLEVYHAMRTSVVTRPEHTPLFDDRFATFWERLGMGHLPSEDGGAIEIDGPPPPGSKEGPPREDESDDTEPSPSSTTTVVVDNDEEDSAGGEVDSVPEDVMLFSADESLRSKDFALLSDEELAEAQRFISRMTWNLGRRLTRRLTPATNGQTIDQRRTLRHALRHGGVPIVLRHRKRKERMRPLVLICDISGSMDRYSRLLLRFVHALELGLESTEVFVFSTRLTRITRELRRRDVDTAIAEVVSAVQDWSGGTRIGESLELFNRQWSRRVLGQGAVVLLITDGLDREGAKGLAEATERLRKSCRRLIWLNPLLRYEGFQPRSQGIRAMLPHVDEFRPVHNLQSLRALVETLSGPQPGDRTQRRMAA